MEEEYAKTIDPKEIPKCLMDNPYKAIVDWSERRFKHIGERLFAYIALIPHSIFIPEMDYEDTSFNCNLSVLFLSPPGGAKCIKEGSRVLVKGGELRCIEDIHSGDIVTSLDETTLKLEEKIVKNVLNNGKQHCLKVKTRSGREISVTKVHPFLTINGWKMTEDLTIGEFIAVPRQYKISGEDVGLKNYEAIILAYLIADGTMKNDIGFTNLNMEMIDEFKRSIMLFDSSLKIRASGGDGVQTYYVSKPIKGSNKPSSIRKWLNELNLMGKVSYNKFVPPGIFTSSRQIISLFLNRLWACDGDISLNRCRDKKRIDISYSSNSIKLCKDVQHLLLRFNILSKIRKNITTCNGKRFLSYKTTIRDSDNCKKFIKEIGLIKGKETASKKVLIMGGESNTNIDVIPHCFWEKILQEKALLNKTWADINKERKYKINYQHKNQDIGRSLLTQLELPIAKKYANSDILWDKIVSLEKDGENSVFDIEISDNHNFVAEDFIVHNSMCGKAIEEICINPVPFEDITSAQLQSELQGKNHVTIITGDAGRIFRDFDLIKVIEGIISDSRVSRRTKRETLDFSIIGNSFMAGVPQDLTSYLSSGYLSRFVPISILHKKDEQDKIGKAIVDSLGNKSGYHKNGITIEDIKLYYRFLWQIQQGRQANNGFPKVKGYVFIPDFKSQIYNMWKNYRAKADTLKFTNYYRELISGFKYLFCSAFLNLPNREVRDGYLVPTQEDLSLALILQQRELKTKIHLLRNNKIAKKTNDIDYLEKVSKELGINEVDLEMIKILASDAEQ